MSKLQQLIASHPILTISILLVVLLIGVFIFCHDTNYRASSIISIISTLITIVVINTIFDNARENEYRQKQIREAIRLNNLFYIYLCQYKGTYDRIFGLDELKYSDMSKLFQPSPSRIILSLQPAYIGLFRVWIALYKHAESFISKLDIGNDNNQLVTLLEQFITDNTIVEELFVSLQTTINMADEDKRILESTTEPPEITNMPNLHDRYVAIYNLLNKNNKFIVDYFKIIEDYKKKIHKC